MRRVLVVDDSRFMQEEIIHALTGTGYEVCACCRDAEEAFHAYEREEPDFVLMDIVLPGIDGIDATGRILQKWPTARVVMVSSLAYDEDIQRARETGARSFLFKPFTPQGLLQALLEAEEA